MDSYSLWRSYKKNSTPTWRREKPGRSGRDLWRLPRIALRAIHTDSRPSADSVYQWFNPKAGLNSAAIAARPSQSTPVISTTLEKRGNTDKTSIFPTLFDKTMTAPLVLSTSTSKNIVLGSTGSGNTLTLGCNPCSIKGETTLFFKAKGVLFEFPQISVTWEGDLDITAVLALKPRQISF
ncbi:hypothetical protein BASA83_007436 [Batrachochytrium salamandrivorans]|nr:hypothetical protein BASA83_007436 [Batrachochytrium salamandrivorans]